MRTRRKPSNVSHQSGYRSAVKPSHAYDRDLHEPGTAAASGRCSQHQNDGPDAATCTGEAVISFQDRDGRWQSGCSAALEQLVERGEIAPLGQGA
jgi:hypothetical protein